MSEYIVEVSEWVIDANGNPPFRKSPEIVRCKDCVYMSDDGLTTAWCNENCREVRPIDFCAWGERIEG